MATQGNKIKKELTLIESVAEHSKEVIGLNKAIDHLKQYLYAISRCHYNPIDNLGIKNQIAELNRQIDSIKTACTNLMKARYTSEGLIIPDNFCFSSTEMAAGYILIDKKVGYVKDGKHVVKLEKNVLFLADNEEAFLEIIHQGEIHPYDNVSERLKHTKSLWRKNSIKDEFLQKYQEVNDNIDLTQLNQT